MDPVECTITGTDDRDIITGTTGLDVICALGGNDIIRNHGGAVIIFAGDDDDFVSSSGGNDLVFGEDGKDVLVVGSGADLLVGDAVGDRLYGGLVVDIVFGGPGADRLYGSSLLQGTSPMQWWNSYNVEHHFPGDWASEIMRIANSQAIERKSRFLTVNRDNDITVKEYPVLGVDGEIIARELPWLTDLYRGAFLSLAQRSTKVRVRSIEHIEAAISINIQRGTKGDPIVHVDSIPLEGLLCVTSHPEGTGGEIVFGNSENLQTQENFTTECTSLYMKSGELTFFNGSQREHYVRPLNGPEVERVVVVLRYLTPD